MSLIGLISTALTFFVQYVIFLPVKKGDFFQQQIIGIFIPGTGEWLLYHTIYK